MLAEYLRFKQISNKRAGEAYKNPIQKFLEFVNKPESLVKIGDIAEFIEELKDKKSLATIAWYLNAIRDYLRFCGNRLDFKIPKYKFNPYTAVSREEFELMDTYLATETENFANLQKRLLIHFLFWTGIRVSELVDIKWTAINFSIPELYIENRKNRESRWIFWPENTHLLLIEFIRQRKAYLGDWLFCTYEGKMGIRTVQRFLKNLGITLALSYSLSPHCFRHGFAMYRINRGIELKALQRLMGHTNPISTLRYVNYSKGELEKTARGYLT